MGGESEYRSIKALCFSAWISSCRKIVNVVNNDGNYQLTKNFSK